MQAFWQSAAHADASLPRGHQGSQGTMIDELILAVARAANLPAEQAALAVAAMLRFFTARLPSSLVGELHARLDQGNLTGEPPTPRDP